ncbi:MAG: GGDEF domain-containing protein [Planctomycetes bacterium]|nr:GGDEF domain-containing protein [Planctomycetota bacterium]
MKSIPYSKKLGPKKSLASAEIATSVEKIAVDRAQPPSITPINGQASCVVASGNGKILAADHQVAGWLGAPPTFIAKYSLPDLIPKLDLNWIDRPLASELPPPHLLQTRIRRCDGADFYAAISITPLLGPEEVSLLVTIRPLESSAEYAFRCDALTGLPDRRELSAHRSRWQQFAPDRRVPHAVLFMDLDNFKQINDRHGHATGDHILATLATRWKRFIRDDDLLVRYGGDEFVILLASVRQLREIEPVVDRLIAATTEPIVVDNQPLRVGATIGVALAKDVSTDLDQLIASADRDMYRQKRRPEEDTKRR